MDVVALSPSAPAELLQEWQRLQVELWREELPFVDPPVEAETHADLDSDATTARSGLALVDRDAVAAVASIWLPLLEDLDLAWVSLYVDPSRRRRGTGRALLDAVIDAVRSHGRSRLETDAIAGGPGEQFASAVGARVTQVDVTSVLDIDGVDSQRLRALARVRDPSYRLVQWRGPCPDALVDRFAVVRTGMNDAPQGDEPHEDWAWDAARVRELEDRRETWHMRSYTTAALDESSGELAGFTELLDTGRPTTALQEDTAVVRTHRGHGLGMAMKAANLQTLLAEQPRIRKVITWNARDNTHMRAVNTDLGFQARAEWLDLSLRL